MDKLKTVCLIALTTFLVGSEVSIPQALLVPEITFDVCHLKINKRDFGKMPCVRHTEKGVLYVAFFPDSPDRIEVVFANHGSGFVLIYISPQYQRMVNSIDT